MRTRRGRAISRVGGTFTRPARAAGFGPCLCVHRNEADTLPLLQGLPTSAFDVGGVHVEVVVVAGASDDADALLLVEPLHGPDLPVAHVCSRGS